MSHDPFQRVVCGLDGTSESVEALQQAALLAHEDTQLVLVTVDDAVTIAAAAAPATGLMVPPPMPAAEAGHEWLDAGRELLTRDFPELRHVETRLLGGPVLPTMLKTLAEENASLAALGRHGHSRLAGLVVGSVTTSLLHDAPCSVLVTGPLTDAGSEFPRSITVGFDGSEESRAALGAGAEIARRKGSKLRAVCASGGKHLEQAELQARLAEAAPRVELELEEGSPTDVLGSQACDLLVLGSRGLHGLKSLGSISERVAHGASGAVLVVRPPAEKPK